LLNADKCIGGGTGEMLAGEVFEVGEDWICNILVSEPEPELQARVAEAVAACPTRALRIE